MGGPGGTPAMWGPGAGPWGACPAPRPQSIVAVPGSRVGRLALPMHPNSPATFPRAPGSGQRLGLCPWKPSRLLPSPPLHPCSPPARRRSCGSPGTRGSGER